MVLGHPGHLRVLGTGPRQARDSTRSSASPDPSDLAVLRQPGHPGGDVVPAGLLQRGPSPVTHSQSGPLAHTVIPNGVMARYGIHWYVLSDLPSWGCRSCSCSAPWSCSGGSRATSPRSSEATVAANIAVDVVDVSKRFRLYTEKYQSLKERFLHAGRNPYRGLLGASGHQLRDPRGPDGRDPGPKRLGEVDAAQVRLGDPPAHRGQGRRAGQPGRAAGARGRLPARAVGTGEHLPERVAARAVHQGSRQALRRDRRLRRARAVHRQPGQVLLVGDVRPAGVRRGRQRRPRHPRRGRGAGRRRRGVLAQVHGEDQGVPGRRPDDPLRHPLLGPGPPDLRLRRRLELGGHDRLGPRCRRRAHLPRAPQRHRARDRGRPRIESVWRHRCCTGPSPISSVEVEHPGLGSRSYLLPVGAADRARGLRSDRTGRRRCLRPGDLRPGRQTDLRLGHRDPRPALRRPRRRRARRSAASSGCRCSTATTA